MSGARGLRFRHGDLAAKVEWPWTHPPRWPRWAVKRCENSNRSTTLVEIYDMAISKARR